MLSVQIDGGKENGIQNTVLLIVAGSSSLYRGSELIESSLFTLPDSAFILYRYVERKNDRKFLSDARKWWYAGFT